MPGTTKDYCNFLNVALASACELAYLLTLAIELEFILAAAAAGLIEHSSRVVKQMQALVDEMEARLAEEEGRSVCAPRGPQTDR